MEMIETDKNLLAFALFDRQPVDIERHGKRIDADILDRHRTMQCLACLANRHGFGDRRQHKETQQCKNGNQNDEPDGIAQQPAGTVRVDQRRH